ncbi:MAG: thiol reductant ABC exporter subunit CydC [Levilactobacillus sp.]|jgi:ATP-binding cassette subfamily C protein CydC|uniref:Thiol reductant ABC exporter subunit CydC n=1 Tax=Levilactobacillus suantsaiihabitans TaxID=2487722 RepID=A0A4Z0J7F8_9LACO|nr:MULTISPECIES: thiol reductant ABC exporter subunit CydC [Levilactobacillus]MCH4123853.1 thiol reductant ABC exporter subunit CydC [Levilactobacillus sp.]MCI1553951.1 thiol reductant ABC exporter subunit CydC [Levilactobacillus sp.]MCI1599143.1 thiol reductant ABC exporter subunit CydC [Levilactobacillus sp.]MCI1605466.1 thiol reductant ABC exporter subunit CydC [Levilactobacillus sp.]TGD18582.1 thiol reductant ABC exporter subunit CydC [Levilactobacillus suantsaiihabitans]
MKGFFATFKHDHWVMPYLRRYRKLLALVLFLGFMTFFCGGALMFNSGYLISRAATHPYNILMIYVPIVLARAFGIGRPAFRYAERLTSHNWVLRIVSDFRKRLYQAVEKQAVAIRQTHQTGDVLSILAEDIDHIENLYLRTVFPLVIGWLLYLFVVIGIGYFNWAFGLLMLILLGVIVIFMPLLSVAVNGRREFQARQVQRRFYTQLTDAVLGLGDWLISGRRQAFLQQQDQPIDEIATLRRADHHFQWWRNFAIQFIFGAAVVLIVWWAGLTFTHNQAEANWVAAFGLALFPTVEPFSGMSQGVSEWPVYQDSIKRVNRLDEHEPELPAQTTIGALEELKLDHVSFTYPGAKREVIDDLSLDLHPGEKLALLGPSGTGKSTLLKLILGDEQPSRGQVTLNGVPVSQLQTQRAQLFGVLDQQPYLFDTTVMNNVRLGNLNATDEDVHAAVKAVELDDLVGRLPQGYDTEVQEAGSRFSGGERQRLSLARILLQDAPIIILDEPTVSLDPITEQHLLDTVFSVLHDKTIIWVTHHLAGINHVDQVRFIEDGHFDMQGTPAQLYQDNARFRSLYDLDRGK